MIVNGNFCVRSVIDAKHLYELILKLEFVRIGRYLCRILPRNRKGKKSDRREKSNDWFHNRHYHVTCTAEV
jgi:hypothetical protein